MTDTNNVIHGPPDDRSSTSSNLIEGLRGQSADAWQRAARLYGPLVYGWARRAGLREQDSEDVVQEVFRTVVAKVRGFRRDRAGDTFRGWLWTITRNKIGDQLRRSGMEPGGVGGSDALRRMNEVPATGPEGSTADSAGSGMLYARAMELIRSEFEDRSWQAFWQTAIEDRSPADVASSLDMTLNAAYLAKSRILRRLREVLGDRPD